jgi:YVTN family beta-propeller protein
MACLRPSLLLLVLLLAPSASPARAAGAVLVMNSNEATLSVIDLASHREVGRIPVLRQPHHWALTPDGRDLLVGDSLGNELFILDPSSFDVRAQIPFSDPYQFGFSPDGKYLVVNSLSRAQVSIYEPGTWRLVKRFALRSMPSHLAFSPDGSRVFVSLQGTGQLAAIDLRTLEVLWISAVGTTPAGVLWLNGRVLVANMGSADVAVVDPANGRVERQIPTGKGAHQLYLSPDGKRLYVNNRLDYHSVVVLDPASFAVLHRYVVLGGADDLAFAPDGKIWLTLRLANKVAVLDPASGAVEDIAVGRAPHGIFLNPRALVSHAVAAR